MHATDAHARLDLLLADPDTRAATLAALAALLAARERRHDPYTLRPDPSRHPTGVSDSLPESASG